MERSIRTIAAEFDVPVTVTYSNWRKGIKPEDLVPIQGKNGSDEDKSWLCPCFWEYQDSNLDQDYREQIPNTGSYDLVVSILWSKLGTRISSACVMPDGSQPQTANEYEVAWVLDQLKRTPGFPELHIYRNQSTPPAPLQPREQRESFFREWDAVQEFFRAWERQTPFAEACTNYSNLQEFENVFREHFRDFLARQVAKEVVTRKKGPGLPNWSLEPYRGLRPFECEQAPIFFGRTKAVGEILDALNRQSKAQKPFVLVLGPAGSGKSSLVRAGVLPLLIEVGNSAGEGPWRRAITRPGSGVTEQDPLDALATALLREDGLPELQPGNPRDAGRNLASELRERPDMVASRAKDILDRISREEMDHLLLQDDGQSLIPGRIEFAELARHRKLRRARPQAQLALVVDHLEDLFTAGFSQESQQQYVAAIGCLVRTQRIVVVATLQSEFYESYQRLPELVTLSSPAGRYDIQAPVRQELAEMIRLPAKAAGLRFDREKEQSLDEALADAAAERTDSLPLLEFVLSQLYEKQLDRRDGLLRFSDYREIGGFDGALARHAESAFTALGEDAQHSFDFVFRRLVALGPDGKTISRPALHKDLTSSPEHDDRRNAGSRELVECMLKEGLFTAENESGKVVVVRIAEHVLLSKWPRIEQWLIEDQAFVRMRDRIDGCRRLWEKRGRHARDLLRPGLSLADGQTLINHFHSCLSDAEIDYIQKSLAGQKRPGRKRLLFGLPIVIALGSLAAAAGIHWFSKERTQAISQEYNKIEQKITQLANGERGRDDNQLRQLEEKARLAQQRAETALTERASLEAQLKKAQDDSRRAQQNVGLASSQRSDLQTQLKQALKQAQQDAELAAAQRSDLQTQLKQAQDKLQQAQQAQQDAERSAAQRSDLQTQLKQAQDKLQQAQQNVGLASSQRSDLQTQLKQAQDKFQQVQQNAELAAAQRSDLQTQLKQTQDKFQQAQQNAELASSQRSDLQAQLKQAQDKLQQAQQNVGLASSQRSDLQTQLKQAQDKLQQAQQNAELASSQRSDLQTQLKEAQDKLQQAQQNAELASSQRSDLQTQLKEAQDKLQQAQQNAELAASQRSDLQTQLKQAQDKFQQAQQNADLATAQRSDLEAQLKQAQDKLQQAQQNAELVSSQRSDLQAQLKQAQDKFQKAQQNADLASSQHSDLQAQLKQAQDKFQQAQQNAELASSQRSDLQAQLKQAQDKLQQVQQNAALASSQRSDLQTQLKQAQDKLQQDRRETELASSERAELLAQLKKAEERAQLAQKIVDLVSGQPHSEDNGNAKSETPKRNVDSAPNQSRSGRALPLDAGQNSGSYRSTQPLIPSVQSANH